MACHFPLGDCLASSPAGELAMAAGASCGGLLAGLPYGGGYPDLDTALLGDPFGPVAAAPGGASAFLLADELPSPAGCGSSGGGGGALAGYGPHGAAAGPAQQQPWPGGSPRVLAGFAAPAAGLAPSSSHNRLQELSRQPARRGGISHALATQRGGGGAGGSGAGACFAPAPAPVPAPSEALYQLVCVEPSAGAPLRPASEDDARAAARLLAADSGASTLTGVGECEGAALDQPLAFILEDDSASGGAGAVGGHDDPAPSVAASRASSGGPPAAAGRDQVTSAPGGGAQAAAAAVAVAVPAAGAARDGGAKAAACTGKTVRTGPCTLCHVTESPQWRRGPASKPVLCNACGTRFRRTGRLTLPAPLSGVREVVGGAKRKALGSGAAAAGSKSGKLAAVLLGPGGEGGVPPGTKAMRRA